MTKRLGEVSHARAGKTKSRGLGDGLEFADHRDYAPGDDVRFVDWAYFARMEKLLLRLFHEHSESDVAILLDTSGSMLGERFDQARRIAAAMGFVAMCGGRRVVIQPFSNDLGTHFRSARDRTKILPVLDFLAELSPNGHTNLPQCVRGFDIKTKGISTVMLISDFFGGDNDLHEGLRILSAPRKHRDVTIFHVFSPNDDSPPLGGNLTLRDSETQAELELQITPLLRSNYLKQWAAMRNHIQQTARRHNVTSIPARSDTPFEELILRTLRIAKVLG
jgi:uncharacterized protein (DUF58 family)